MKPKLTNFQKTIFVVLHRMWIQVKPQFIFHLHGTRLFALTHFCMRKMYQNISGCRNRTSLLSMHNSTTSHLLIYCHMLALSLCRVFFFVIQIRPNAHCIYINADNGNRRYINSLLSVLLLWKSIIFSTVISIVLVCNYCMVLKANVCIVMRNVRKRFFLQ